MLHLFTHIPKTGGTSFKHSVIELNVAPERVYKFKGLRRFLLDSLSSYTFVDGHFPYGVHLFTRQKCIYYTILRDPIDHAISFYNFVRQCDYPNYKHPLLDQAKRLSFMEFTEKHANLQTRMLAGFPWNRILNSNSPRQLQIAMKHLEHKYCDFGFLHDLESFERKIAARFEWKCNPVYEQSKITRVRPKVQDLSREELKKLQTIQSLDLQLFSFAESLQARRSSD